MKNNFKKINKLFAVSVVESKIPRTITIAYGG